jgi:hypothetical protein
MYYISKYTQQILDRYENHLSLYDPVPIGFTGTASETLSPVFTHEVSADILIFGFNVDFTNANVAVDIQSRSPQYKWNVNNNANPQYVPIGAIAGVSAQVLPVLPLVQPFFIKANGVLQFTFKNSAAAATTGGTITAIGLKLVGPIDDGWNYGQLNP